VGGGQLRRAEGGVKPHHRCAAILFKRFDFNFLLESFGFKTFEFEIEPRGACGESGRGGEGGMRTRAAAGVLGRAAGRAAGLAAGRAAGATGLGALCAMGCGGHVLVNW
jgi:hypothetical protein